MIEFANDKLRGGYYTEPDIAAWLCEWAIRDRGDSVLEPSCGDGVFLEAAASRLRALGATRKRVARGLKGVEIVRTEALKAAARLEAAVGQDAKECVECAEFFAWSQDRSLSFFNAVIGNPPFIRYHNFPEPARGTGIGLMKLLGLRPNKLTNIWVPFVVASVEMLADGGRLGMVLPAELLQVTYAAQLRSYLVDSFEMIRVITCNELFFENAEQEVVLLLAEGKLPARSEENRCSVDLLQFDAVRDVLDAEPQGIAEHRTDKEVRHDSEKWLKYLLAAQEIGFMRDLRARPDVANLGQLASVDIGVVTGRNAFFVVDQSDVDEWGLRDYVRPLVGRTRQLKGALIDSQEWERLVEEGERVYLFSANGDSTELPGSVADYIAQGERQEFHKGYKCSIRTPWYKVPSVWEPECFLFRQIHDFPRAVVNSAHATSTDTIHRMACNVEPAALVSTLYTHLTAASAEIEGRSYGGGVLELEPTEAERLLVPAELPEGLPLAEIDRMVRGRELEQVLAANDRLVLMDGLGLGEADCAMLQNIWQKLMTRRTTRRKRKRTGK